AGDELVWLLRRLNEEWGTAVLLAEHRLERCLPAADRVLVLEDGAVVSDSAPAPFLEWAAEERPTLATPAATLFARAGLRPPPVTVREARDRLRAAGLLPEIAPRAAGAARADGARRGIRRRPGSPGGDPPTPATSPEGSGSASLSSWCSRAPPQRSCASTSQPAAWTAAGRTSWPRGWAASPTTAPRCSWRRTTPSSRHTSRNARCSSARAT